ncbi:PLD nuclease N-terminal domain-containing protein [Piscibacillus halophilus]|uniref:Phospholipase_D-nuclease N-terminal n=1 Tax=Piscibacillus halophilus TaxID=571933 RepID=A0A1H9GFX0_9BACI|nr:PLD nuclease N-terminal domain-containing protein [Piscibacillus halophilus]SEQ48984.1 Phospholipase_D-nuclease N-terminal [Piscibacillus halophilus]
MEINRDLILLLLPIIILQLILLSIAIIDLIRNEQTNGPKWIWALVIILINIVGPIIYLIFGRRP